MKEGEEEKKLMDILQMDLQKEAYIDCIYIWI